MVSGRRVLFIISISQSSNSKKQNEATSYSNNLIIFFDDEKLLLEKIHLETQLLQGRHFTPRDECLMEEGLLTGTGVETGFEFSSLDSSTTAMLIDVSISSVRTHASTNAFFSVTVPFTSHKEKVTLTGGTICTILQRPPNSLGFLYMSVPVRLSFR
jgi:hypothetical protein